MDANERQPTPTDADTKRVTITITIIIIIIDDDDDDDSTTRHLNCGRQTAIGTNGQTSLSGKQILLSRYHRHLHVLSRWTAFICSADEQTPRNTNTREVPLAK